MEACEGCGRKVVAEVGDKCYNCRTENVVALKLTPEQARIAEEFEAAMNDFADDFDGCSLSWHRAIG